MTHRESERRSWRSADAQLSREAIILDPDLESSRDPGAARLNPAHLFWVFLGGCLGTFGRQAITSHYSPAHRALPWSVLIVNTIGCLLIGLLGGAFFERSSARVSARLFLLTGVLGGWTTYSALAASFLVLEHDRALGKGLLLCVLALITNIVAAAIGLLAGRWSAGRLLS
jgi:CrcB protein